MTRRKAIPSGTSQSGQSEASDWGGVGSGGEVDWDEGGGSVVKALTALQALQVSALIALTFQ